MELNVHILTIVISYTIGISKNTSSGKPIKERTDKNVPQKKEIRY